MKILLILNKTQSKDCRLLVKLPYKGLREKVEGLLKEEKDREAFDLICSKAKVESFVPPGTKLSERPELTLIEDML